MKESYAELKQEKKIFELKYKSRVVQTSMKLQINEKINSMNTKIENLKQIEEKIRHKAQLFKKFRLYFEN